MPSPFPGMNPYLERPSVWHGFHESFIPHAQADLNRQINPSFIAKIDEHVFIHELPEDHRGRFVGRADLGVAEIAASTDTETAVMPAPAEVRLPGVDFERISYLEIRDREDWRLITVIELLSPANKYAGPDREQYLAKRAQLLHSTAHFIEFDLLRGGPRLPLENLPECDYYALVSRCEKRPVADFWPVNVRDPLPVVPIPLTADVPDAKLDLQSVLNRVYDDAGYEHYVYRNAPEPRLEVDDATWAEQFVPVDDL